MRPPPPPTLPLGWQPGLPLHRWGQRPEGWEQGVGVGRMGAVGTEGPKARGSPQTASTPPPLWHKQNPCMGHRHQPAACTRGRAGTPILLSGGAGGCREGWAGALGRTGLGLSPWQGRQEGAGRHWGGYGLALLPGKVLLPAVGTAGTSCCAALRTASAATRPSRGCTLERKGSAQWCG